MAEKKPDWRQANKNSPGAAAGGAPATGAGKRGWQKQTVQAAGPKKPWPRGAKLGLAVFLLAVFVGGVIIVIEWLRPPKAAYLVLMGASYDDNLAVPHNAYGWKALEDISRLESEPNLFTSSGKPTFKPTHKEGEMKGASFWEKEWGKFAREIREKTVVIYLALHGAAAEEPYFFVNDDPSNGLPFARLPFADVLRTFESEPLADKKIVLLLEPALSRANWSAGVVENNFVAKLVEMQAKLKSNLFIICASDAHQVSWPSEEWQQSLFGHFVVEGLRGAADTNGDLRVSASELFEFVRDKVSKRSASQYGVEQTPIFLGDVESATKVEIAQVASAYVPENDSKAPGLDFKIPAELEAAWKVWQALRNMTPHPAAYSPALWRRYQDLLVRYEQLLRAGDPSKAHERVAKQLSQWKHELESEARFEPAVGAASCSLGMVQALGMRLPRLDEDLIAGLLSVWVKDKAETKKEALNELLKKGGGGDAAKRVQIYRAFLKFLESARVKDSDFLGDQGDGVGDPRSKAQAMLVLLEDKLGVPRPAETHFLTMLLRDAPRTPPLDGQLLREALSVRQLAERAALGEAEGSEKHPYSEIVMPWIKKLIDKGDAWRRPGEDYLFSSSRDDWENKARPYLKDAQESYRAALKKANLYRDALDTRDQALAELPYFAQWVANQRVSAENKIRKGSVEEWVKQVGELADQLKVLQDGLALKDDKAPSAEAVQGQAAEVAKRIADLRVAVAAETSNLRVAAHRHLDWHDREALLSAPPLLLDAEGAVEDRMILLAFNRATSEKFFKEPAAVDIVGGNTAAERAAAAAKRNMALAAAACKIYWPEKIAAFADGESSLSFGKKLLEIVTQWPKDIYGALDEFQRQGSLSLAAEAVRQADFKSRGLPGGFDDKPEPMSVSRALRHVRMHNLLLAQAQRTTLDHWYSEIQDSKPYYKVAAGKYLDIAKDLVEVKGGPKDRNDLRTNSAQRKKDELTADVGFRLEGKKDDYWTSEREFPIKWTVGAPDDPFMFDPNAADGNSPPAAVAVTWRGDFGEGSDVQWQDKPEPDWRKAIEIRQRDFTDAYQLTLKSEKKSIDPVQAKYTLLLRGQLDSRTTRISQKQPDLIVHDFPKPKTSLINVRMDKSFNYGAVSIAVDISGSMIWKSYYGLVDPDDPKGAKAEKKTRFEFALLALEKTLTLIPEGTEVSVFAFYTENNAANRAKGNNALPEVVPIQKVTSWSKDRLPRVLDYLRDLSGRAFQEDKNGNPLGPGGTPLAYTIMECLDKGFPPGFRGAKLILALTDGDDTLSDKMLGLGPREWRDAKGNVIPDRVANFLRAGLGTRDVELHVVCFLNEKDAEQAKEARSARAQFGDIENFENKGSFTIEARPRELSKRMDLALRPRLVVEDNPAGWDPKGIIAKFAHEHRDFKEIPSGNYTVQVKKSPKRGLTIEPGDMISIVLKRDEDDPKKIIYERESYANVIKTRAELFGDKHAMDDRFRVTVMQNAYNLKSRDLTQFIAIESINNAASIEQKTPPFVWIESKPKTLPPPLSVRWFREYGYPALGYRVMGAKWPAAPAEATPTEVKVYVANFPMNDGFAERYASAKTNKPSTSIKFRDNQFAIVEEVASDTVSLATDSRKVGLPEESLPRQNAIVVRVQHAKDKPVLVKLLDGKHKGEEHRFYSDANKYTATFWDLANPNQQNFEFAIIFLNSFKAATTPAVFSITDQSPSFDPPDDRMGN